MRKLISFFSFLFCVASTFATHNRAGQISYKHISGLTYEFTVTIFADPTSQAINRRELEINWGDNTGVDSVQNSPPNVIVVPGKIIKRNWIARHTFLGPGDFTISVTDRNRNGGVENISNSSSVPFYVETKLRIFPFSGIYNDSPTLLNDPIDDACIGSRFVHNPGAVDPDGDSLAYSISESFGQGGQIAPGFTFPPATNRLYVNAITGDLIWENPALTGIFNIAILISEYRQGVFLGSVLRDLQIQVYAGCNNKPPTISLNRLVCGEAGSNISVPIQGFDQDVNDDVRLSYTGEIFDENIVEDTAIVNKGSVNNPTSDLLVWRTNCSDIRETAYGFSIKATDNGQLRGFTDLTTFDNGAIKVVGPSVKNFTAINVEREIHLSWDTNSCFNANGYNIYRRINRANFIPTSCELGVPASTGYTLIATLNDPILTSFIDKDSTNGLVPGQNYCYLITSKFPGEEGYSSVEVCAIVPKIVPLMTQVSVDSTDVNNGVVKIGWSPPDTNLTTGFIAPFRYLVYQRINDQVTLIDSTLSLNDTTLTIRGLNTSENSYAYRVELFSDGSGNAFVGKSAWANSMFIKIEPSDNKLSLLWSDFTPWNNDSFIVYRKLETALLFDSVGTTNTNSFIDLGLENGDSYCYYIRSIGKYNLTDVKNPIENLSQINCGTPVDNEIPCAPILTVNSDCNFDQLDLSWNNPNLTCVNGVDVVGYRIYRADSLLGDFVLLEIINEATTTQLVSTLNSIAGCYAITAIDSSGNESLISNKECVDYCPIYELPNIFTPNGDGWNDLFIPVENPKFRYVESIELHIYNRWGELVFKTKDPEIKWNGEHVASKEIVSDGIYFYSCIVNELSLTGIKTRVIKGSITVQDGQSQNVE